MLYHTSEYIFTFSAVNTALNASQSTYMSTTVIHKYYGTILSGLVCKLQYEIVIIA